MAATLTKGTTYANGGSVTHTNLNAHVDSATLSGVDSSSTEANYGVIVRAASAPEAKDSLWYDTANTILKAYNSTTASWAPVMVRMIDADKDTIVYCEKTTDEDQIRMDCGGTESFKLTATDLTLATQPMVLVTRNTDQAFNTGSAVQCQLANEVFDVKGEYDTGTYTYTASTAGIYYIYFQARFAITAGDLIKVYIYLDGSASATAIHDFDSGGEQTLAVSLLYDISAASTVKAYVENTNTNDTIKGGAVDTFMFIAKVA